MEFDWKIILFIVIFISIGAVTIIIRLKQSKKLKDTWQKFAQSHGLTYTDDISEVSEIKKLGDDQLEMLNKMKATGTFKMAAKLLGFNFLYGKYNGTDIRIYTIKKGRQGSTYTVYCVEVNFDKSLNLGLEIYKEGFFSKTGKLLGVQDIQIGWKELDDLVMIKGNSEEAVQHFLNRDGVKEAIRDLISYEKTVNIDDTDIHFETGYDIMKDQDQLFGLLDKMTETMKKIKP
ncbi:MAG: hypothetical protein OEZ36_06620 [Spirochaetota bacterium]|nr:hypothetical protein [Spirochaetota bacterium]